ncbi:hypothetical protein V8F20_002674 [Naviculisporaceae sp. PSN 640]
MNPSDDTNDSSNSAYEWLADLSKRQCFTTSSVAHPATTLDFGDEGFTASLTDGHELVQLTRPDATCGLVYLRGSFPDGPGSILARSQRRDDGISFASDTFGTTILPPQETDEVELGERKAQGWVNFRWPYSQYELYRQDTEETGTCEVISFVSRDTVFQINRLKWGHGSSVSETIDTGERGSRRGRHDREHYSPPAVVRLRVGGKVRFGCPCSNNNPKGPTPESDRFTVRNSGKNTLDCMSEKYGTRLEIGFSDNGVPWNFKSDDGARMVTDQVISGPWADLSSEIRVQIPGGEATYFVSTYALRKDNEDDDKDYSLELPADLQLYLGVHWESEHMTDRLWTALCSTNYEAAEAVEFCVVGRCVEQILSVTSIPVRRPPGDSGLPQRALINNIMTSQIVDVESAFYQIRLLAKIYNFIQTRKLEPDLLDPFLSLEVIRTRYLERIHPIIRACLAWLFATNLKPDRLLLAVHSRSISTDDPDHDRLTACETARILDCSGKRISIDWDQSYNRGCYATMAAWYALKLCPEAISTREDYTFVTEIVLPNLPVAYELGKSRANRDKQPTSKGNVLGWLHFSVILMFYDVLGCEENELPDGVDREDFNRVVIEETQQRFEKYVSRLKTSQAGGWTMEHEELDRVVLLAEEMALNLGFDEFPSLRRSRGLAISRASRTRKIIHDRQRTTKFFPGPRPWMAARGMSNAPWELFCINHESYLRVADYASVTSARDRVMQFLLSDYSLMASWDRADANMVGRWWDIQPVAIVCSTLVDLRLEGKLPSAAPLDPPPGPSTSGQDDLEQSIPTLQAAPTVNFDAAEFLQAQAGGAPDSSATQIAMLRILVQQLKESIKESGKAQAAEIQQIVAASLAGAKSDGMIGLASGRAFEWAYHKPDPIYYPEWWVKAIGDASNVVIDDVNLLDVIDVYQNDKFLFEAKWKRSDTLLAPRPTPTPKVRDTLEPSALGPRMRSSRVVDTRVTGTRSLPVTPVRGPGRETPGLASEKAAEPQILTNDELLKTLNHSLLDIGIKHRIFFVQRFSPTLKSSLCRWHPDAEPAIDAHFGATSRFTESREASIWTTSITVSHWTMRTKAEYDSDPYNEPRRQHGEFPPRNVADFSNDSPSPTSTKIEGSEHIVEEQATSLVFTGDSQGYMWLCSVLSSTVHSRSVAEAICDKKKGVPRLLKKFIHQQGSARGLVFLLLLGHVCERLAGGYEDLLKRLDEIMEIGDRTLLEGLEEWFNTEQSINKLKKMLWGWEALRVFNDKLNSSISQIQRAQEAMEHVIKQDAAQQHVILIQEYTSVMDDFKRRHSMLVDVHEKVQLKIKQVTGLRDGISTITNVIDTQTALADNKTTIQQNNHIRTLTYITIVYLPLGLVCALFSLEEGDVLKGASKELFGGLMVICSLLTYGLAYILDKFMVNADERSWKSSLKVLGGLGGNITIGRSKRGGAGFTKAEAGGPRGSSGVGPRETGGAVIVEMEEMVRRSAESPGKGWLSGVTTAREAELDGAVGVGAPGAGGAVLVRRSSGSAIV